MKNGDPSHGKQLFVAAGCGGCHTLADAGATGTVGPNLDDAFRYVKLQGFSVQSMADVIRGQIAYPDPKGPMKPDLVTGQDANDVAAYVAKCSANPHCGVTASHEAAPATTTTATTTTAAAPSSSTAQGKQVFQTAGCGSCHTLKDAGTTGTVGPNLDQLKPSDARVVKQVTNGGKIMPSFKSRLTKAQIAAVAAYVSSVAGK